MYNTAEKAENILLSNQDSLQIKLTDFGLAKIKEEASVMNTMCGTPQYIAPEIHNASGDGSSYGTPVDMWSSGVLLYFILSKSFPFDDESSDTSLSQAITEGHFTFSSGNWENVSAEAKDLISKLLTLDPNERWSASQALSHLWFSSSLDPPLRTSANLGKRKDHNWNDCLYNKKMKN